MSEIFVFPSSRRIGLIRSVVGTMLHRSPNAAENYLAYRLRAHAEALARRGIPGEVLIGDCKALENAVRAEVRRRVMGRGGVK